MCQPFRAVETIPYRTDEGRGSSFSCPSPDRWPVPTMRCVHLLNPGYPCHVHETVPRCVCLQLSFGDELHVLLLVETENALVCCATYTKDWRHIWAILPVPSSCETCNASVQSKVDNRSEANICFGDWYRTSRSPRGFGTIPWLIAHQLHQYEATINTYVFHAAHRFSKQRKCSRWHVVWIF